MVKKYSENQLFGGQNTIMKKSYLLLACLALNVTAYGQQANESESVGGVDRQTPESFRVSLDLNYLLYLPSGYETGKQDSSDKKWPLLVFLHGAGERGDDLDIVKRHGPPKLAAEKNFPFVMISPQCPAGSFWNVDHLLQLIEDTIKERNIDPDRVYLTGLSMGGYGSWALAAEAPEMFAAVAPVCGGDDPKNAEKIKDIPIWAFHGDADRVVPISGSQKMVDAIKNAGGSKIEFTVYEGVGHDSWTETYSNDELYGWFLKQRRSER